MAELSLQERLQPALLDRLADDEPEKRTESRDQRVMSIARLRNCILRDLSWLLNTVRLQSTEDLSEVPLVEKSVLNYGVPSFAGDSIDRLGIPETEAAIREAILRYEPRLIANSVKVKLAQDSMREDAHNTIALEIDAELWCQPLPLHMFMKTELDLEIGAARVIEQTEAERAATRTRRRR
jgi:type VI secretion system protein ImpF